MAEPRSPRLTIGHAQHDRSCEYGHGSSVACRWVLRYCELRTRGQRMRGRSCRDLRCTSTAGDHGYECLILFDAMLVVGR